MQDAGILLRDFDDAVARLCSDQQEKAFEATYPNHLRDIAPVFRIDPNKELEIIANKYRLQAEQMNELAQTRLMQISGVSKSGKSLNSSTSMKRSASVAAIRSDKRGQNILGESAIINESTTGGALTSRQAAERNQKIDFFNRVPGANIESTMRQKIKVVRWLSKMIAEYDVTNDFWTATQARLTQPFRPFSTTVYLPNQDLVVLGGLDDSVPNKPTF